MKRLKGMGLGRLRDTDGGFECDEIVLELDLEHVAEMFRLKGGEVHGDLRPRSASRLAILPDTTHVTLMQRMPVIVPMVTDFLDAKPQSKTESQGMTM